MMAAPNNGTEAEAVAAAINGLVNVRQQSDLQRDVSSEATAAIFDQDNERDEERITNLQQKIVKLQKTKKDIENELAIKGGNPAMRAQVTGLKKKVDKCDADIEQTLDEIEGFRDRIVTRLEKREAALQKASETLARVPPAADGSGGNGDGVVLGDDEKAIEATGPVMQEGESIEEFLIRTGKITPFNIQNDRDLSEFVDANGRLLKAHSSSAKPHQQLRTPGFASQPLKETIHEPVNLATQEFSLRTRKRRHIDVSGAEETGDDSEGQSEPTSKRITKPTRKDKGRGKEEKEKKNSDDDYVDVDGSGIEADEDAMGGYDDTRTDSKANRAAKALNGNIDLSRIDDGNTSQYELRLRKWVESRAELRRSMGEEDIHPVEDEWFKPTPGKADVQLLEGYKLPGEVGEFLFPFQKVGVEWLCQLHSRLEGGLLCDEMGLGKTVQIIAAIVALHYSKQLEGPVIIVSPSTLMAQWVQHFHTWWPPLRVSILHSSGSGMLNPNEEDDDDCNPMTSRKLDAARSIVNNVKKNGHVLITTYKGLQTYLDELADVEWGYVALDEGHLIRNRNTEAAKACKQLATYNRIVMSGTPIQNNLRELFSLFEFAYPGLLGTDTRTFAQHFEMPIRDGHHRNASRLAIMTAEKCAHTLRETVKPYMLRRIKADVANSLPPKSEQVFFCKLAPDQEEIYQKFLQSPHIQRIIDQAQQRTGGGQRNEVFAAIDALRKICNHPDLRYAKNSKNRLELDDNEFGNPVRSTKMQVLISLLRISKNFGHKTLVFSQSLPMLDIIETYLKDENFKYCRMDGSTNQMDRQPMVDRFNKSDELEVFLLTPQTGGVGLNLTGANRVILFDPSWNPATDKQAVERAWRLGQKRPVEIYRLLTPRTIEEKIYRKQLYKQFMTDKIMTDTDFHRSFDSSSLADMFTYRGDEEDRDTEVFAGAETKHSADTSAPAVLSTEEAAAVADVDQVQAIEEFHEEKTEAEKGMLDDLFSRNIDSAYNHDKIVNAKQRIAANKRFLQEEAERLNQQTKQFIQDQAMKAYKDRHGIKLPSAAERLRAAKGRPAVLERKPVRNKPVIDKMWTQRSLQAIIIEFFEENGGKAYTADITNYFNSKYRDLPGDLFRKALEATARVTEERSKRNGTKLWRLKKGKNRA